MMERLNTNLGSFQRTPMINQFLEIELFPAVISEEEQFQQNQRAYSSLELAFGNVASELAFCSNVT
jgi:hypothetical protein